jgi:hypothetical protein
VPFDDETEGTWKWAARDFDETVLERQCPSI